MARWLVRTCRRPRTCQRARTCRLARASRQVAGRVLSACRLVDARRAERACRRAVTSGRAGARNVAGYEACGRTVACRVSDTRRTRDTCRRSFARRSTGRSLSARTGRRALTSRLTPAGFCAGACRFWGASRTENSAACRTGQTGRVSVARRRAVTRCLSRTCKCTDTCVVEVACHRARHRRTAEVVTCGRALACRTRITRRIPHACRRAGAGWRARAGCCAHARACALTGRVAGTRRRVRTGE